MPRGGFRAGGTRQGNGRGYGGPAKGEGSRGAKGVGRPNREAAEVIALQKAARIEAMKEHLIGLALHSERESDQITATLGYLKHEDAGAAPAKVEVAVTTNVQRNLD